MHFKKWRGGVKRNLELLLEPTLNKFHAEIGPLGSLAGHTLDEWNEAYEMVQWYFQALRVRNKLLLNQLVVKVLQRAIERTPLVPSQSATELAVEEMDQVVNEWFAEVLAEPPTQSDDMLSTRGRLALLLADMPVKWQEQFLRPPPWPEEFVVAMRDAFLRAGPNFQLSQMQPRPLDLGPVTTLTNLSRRGMFKYAALLSWALVGAFLVTVFFRAH
jgi:hypothetical protein